MNNTIIFVADWFSNEVNGGGELNNDEFISIVKKTGTNIQRIKSNNLTREILNQTQDCHYIFGNFINVSQDVMDEVISGDIKYSIYEHDHKYIKTRDPSRYANFLAPKEDLCNTHFYSGATAVFCQSKLHSETVEKNLGIDTVHNLSGNIWSTKSLDLLLSISKNKKRNKVCIWDSSNPIKNTSKAIAYCRIKKIPYELVGNLPYENFLQEMGKNNCFMFFPETMETLCRVVVEARMMNMKTITNGTLGATSEDWFSLKGKDLIDLMREKRESIPKYILETIK